MPVTRSTPKPVLVEPLAPSSPPYRRRRPSRELEPTFLTSSDASTSHPGDAIPKKKVRHEKPLSRSHPPKAHVVPVSREIIEISSDDEEETVKSQSSIPPSVIADYRRQINKIREESVKHRRDLERTSKELRTVRDENQKLKALEKPDATKVMLDINQLTDNLDCEICTCRMWTPYILPNCGHTFCQTCIQDWFGAIQAQFLANHPDLRDLAHPLTLTLRQLSEHPHLCTMPYVQALIASQMPPQPKYTCPTCREQVTSRPTEAFTLKALIRSIAVAAGETIPKDIGPNNKKMKASNPVSHPFDGFFPSRKP